MFVRKKSVSAADFDAGYERERGRDNYRNEIGQRIRDQLTIAGSVRGKTILDIGGGSGWFADAALRAGAAAVTIVDFSTVGIELAKRNVPEATAIESDIVSYLKTNRDHFDLVTCFDVLEEMPPGLMYEVVPLIVACEMVIGTPIAAGSLEVSTHQVIYERKEIDEIAAKFGFKRVATMPFAEHLWARYERE